MPSRSAQRAKPPAFVTCVQTIENFFCKLKQFRRIATRYEKRAANYLAMLHIAAITLWL